jgi:hypothetical protein
LINKYSLLNNIIIYLLLALFAFITSKTFGYTMLDDGWRHLAMAQFPNDVDSWGSIYINSLFKDYDPWFTWHNFLNFLGYLFGKENIVLTTNFIIYFLLSLWYHLTFTKIFKINPFLSLFLACFLPLLSPRYLFLRPDSFSGLFILYSVFFSSWLFIFLISILYAYIYYVYWFFMGFMSYVKFVTKDYKSMVAISLALIIGTIFYAVNNFEGFLHITRLILSNDVLREGKQVSEGYPFLIPLSIVNSYGSGIVLVFLTFFSLLSYFVFKPKNKILIYTILLSPLMIIQVRFFIIMQPLLLALAVYVIHYCYFEIVDNSLSSLMDKIKSYLRQRTYFMDFNIKTYNTLILISLLVYFVYLYIDAKNKYIDVHDDFDKLSFIEKEEFNGKNILFTTMGTDGYMAIYANPKANYFPPCAIGMVTLDREDKQTYLDLVTDGKYINAKEFFSLTKANSIDYIIHTPNASNTNFGFNNQELEENGYIFYKIINGYVIFKKINS